MSTIVIGPFALSTSLLAAALSIGAGWWLGERLARRAAVSIEPVSWLVLATGLLAARLAFVWQYRAAYASAPLTILDIRDGGWRPLAGFAAAALAMLAVAAWRTAYRKPLASAWAAALCLWLVAGAATDALQGPRKQLPAITLASLDGAPVPFTSLQGRPVVVNLWASWCPPCRGEMPVLQQAQQRYPDVQFVFANQGEAAGKVQAFVAGHAPGLRNVLLDRDGELARRFGERALPTTLFFDARGQLVATRVGMLSPATLAERLAALPSHAQSSP